MIRWELRDVTRQTPWDGYVGDARKYFVGILEVNGCAVLAADVAIDADKAIWHDLNLLFSTIEDAKQWCETVEATGAY